MRFISRSCLALTFLAVACPATASTLAVGPKGTFTAPCAAFAAANDGDVVEIDSAGNYAGDVCAVSKNNLTIRGTGSGRARIAAAGKNAQGKAIWVVQGQDTLIENVEFSGATVPDANGAGIRQEGKNLTVRNCAFRDNQDGILAGDVPGSEILIEYSEFDHNGAGDGYSHNLYINHVAKLTFRYNYSHRAVIGHLLKSRAAENYILYNRLSGEADGSESYEIDCPNGGRTYVIGNVLEQGVLTDNPTMLSYLAEGTNANNPSTELFVVNNTFINHLGRGTFINVGAPTSSPALIVNNAFLGGGTVCSQATATLRNNLDVTGACFQSDAAFDYHLLADCPGVDRGADPGQGGGLSLAPTEQYLHPAEGEARPLVGTLDVGAYEYVVNSNGGSGATPGTTSLGGGTTASTTVSNQTAPAAGSGATEVTVETDARDGGCGCHLASPTNNLSPHFMGIALALMGAKRRRRSA